MGVVIGVWAILTAILFESPEPAPPTAPSATPTGSWSPLPTRQPSSTPTSIPSGDTVPVDWRIEPWQLRDDVGRPEFLGGIDGSFDAGHLIDAGPVWVMLTDPRAAFAGVAIHGVDAVTGQSRWRLDRDQAMCATELLGDALICAGASRLDPATGLGTSWRIDVIDPVTGQVRRSADFEGWLTMVMVTDGHIVLVEQRLPAPHAVVSALQADLQPVWSLDLLGVAEHARLFSENRIINRSKPLPSGPALDRPRFSTVADGLTAIESGSAVVLIDVAAGLLRGLPYCARLVDDGERLWCNTQDRAVAYSYDVEELYTTEPGIRLAISTRDPRAAAVIDPVFTDLSGQAVKVDLTTGQVLGPLLETGYGEAFGQLISPFFHHLDGTTFTWVDDEYLVAFDARTGELYWDAQTNLVDAVWAGPEGQLVVVHDLNDVLLLDAASGHEWIRQRQDVGLYTTLLGAAMVGTGPDEIARLIGP